MNSRERLQLALSHREPDRVPFDLGGTDVTSIHYLAYRALRRHLGLPEREPELINLIQQTARIDADMHDRLKIDVKNLTLDFLSHFNADIQEKDGFSYFYDDWGRGWRMPIQGGWYYDIFHHPLKEATSVAEIEKYPVPDPPAAADFAGLAERAAHFAQVEQKGVVVWPVIAGFMEMAAFLRGYENFFMDFSLNEKLVAALMRKVLEFKLGYWERALAHLGDNVDAVQETDDLGGQNAMLISPAMYRRIVKPLHRELFDFIHAHTKAKLFFHSCGAIRPVIPDLIELGVDILNPIQVSAKGMDTAELKREFGRDLVFWGGGVDTQYVLGSGTPDDVRADTRRRIRDLAPGGGFVFATVHCIQGDVPPENITAMWETLQKFGEYPIQS